MLAAAARRAQALYVLGANPAVAFPDGERVRRRWPAWVFVVQDLFLTPTAQQADVVLPAASFAEKEGTFTNGEGRVQRVRRAVEPVGEARADWGDPQAVAGRLGRPWPTFPPGKWPADHSPGALRRRATRRWTCQ